MTDTAHTTEVPDNGANQPIGRSNTSTRPSSKSATTSATRRRSVKNSPPASPKFELHTSCYECTVALVEYLAPSLDITISESAAPLRYSPSPRAAEIGRSDPATIAPAAFNKRRALHSPSPALPSGPV
jgi:hypothetical protein